MARYKRDFKWFAAISTITIGSGVYEYTPCAYCGLPAWGTDHVIPTTFCYKLSDMEDVLPHRLWLVPACPECNSMGSDKVFTSLARKRAFIHQCIRRKYKKILRIPEWTRQDLGELSPELARYVVHGLKLREIIYARLRWPRR